MLRVVGFDGFGVRFRVSTDSNQPRSYCGVLGKGLGCGFRV
jgi:hypothetical protein